MSLVFGKISAQDSIFSKAATMERTESNAARDVTAKAGYAISITTATATTPTVQTEENANIPQILQKYINETVNFRLMIAVHNIAYILGSWI